MGDEHREAKKREQPRKVSPVPAEESPELMDRLILKAAGVGEEDAPPSHPFEEHQKELRQAFESMMGDLSKARARVEQSVERAEKIADCVEMRVENFWQVKLPQLTLSALDRAGELQVRACLAPLRNEVENLTLSLQKVQAEVERSFWWMLGILVAGSLVAGICGGSLVCYYLRTR